MSPFLGIFDNKKCDLDSGWFKVIQGQRWRHQSIARGHFPIRFDFLMLNVFSIREIVKINSTSGLTDFSIPDIHQNTGCRTLLGHYHDGNCGEDRRKIATCRVTDSLTHRQTDFIICPMLLMHWADNKWLKLLQPNTASQSRAIPYTNSTLCVFAAWCCLVFSPYHNNCEARLAVCNSTVLKSLTVTACVTSLKSKAITHHFSQTSCSFLHTRWPQSLWSYDHNGPTQFWFLLV